MKRLVFVGVLPSAGMGTLPLFAISPIQLMAVGGSPLSGSGMYL